MEAAGDMLHAPRRVGVTRAAGDARGVSAASETGDDVRTQRPGSAGHQHAGHGWSVPWCLGSLIVTAFRPRHRLDLRLLVDSARWQERGTGSSLSAL